MRAFGTEVERWFVHFETMRLTGHHDVTGAETVR